MMKTTSTIALLADRLMVLEGNFIMTILICLRRTTTIRIGGEDGETVIANLIEIGLPNID